MLKIFQGILFTFRDPLNENILKLLFRSDGSSMLKLFFFSDDDFLIPKLVQEKILWIFSVGTNL